MTMIGENKTYSVQNLSQCHFDNDKSHKNWPQIEARPTK